jgi:hypothetical protein
LQGDSFISLGGPKVNGVTKDVMQILGVNLPVSYDESSSSLMCGGRTYAAKLDQNGLVEEDFGLVVRLPHLDVNLSTSNAVLIAFGIHGHGTGQAVQAVISNERLKKEITKANENDFWALLKFNFNNHNPIGSAEIIASGTMHRG